jgi:WXG100 family type VII secretion target
MVNYTLTLDKMNDLVASLRLAAQRIEAELVRLEQSVDSLRSGWDGCSALAYDTAHRRWRDSLLALNRALDNAAGVVEGAVDGHLAARSAVTRIWG